MDYSKYSLKEKVTYSNNIGKEQLLWRYMSFSQFMCIVEFKAIWFSKLDNFTDKSEGEFNLDDMVAIMLGNTPYLILKNQFSKDKHRLLPEEFKHIFYNIYEDAKKNTFVNCWNCDDTDSELMWSKYTSNNPNSVAIVTKYEMLVDAFAYCKENFFFEIRKINYVNEKKHIAVDSYDKLGYVFLKRKRYHSESELRVVAYKLNEFDSGLYEFKYELKESGGFGLNIPVELNRLVDTIAINPDADSWFVKLIEKICYENGFKCKMGDEI